jgi:hypothetical protein
MHSKALYRMHSDKIACDYIKHSKLGKFLKYVKNNTEMFNKYIKYFYDSTENPYDTEGSLTSQCWQTTRTLKYLLSNNSLSDFNIDLEPLYSFKIEDEQLTLNNGNISRDEMIRIFDKVFDTSDMLNVCIYIAGNSDDNDITIFPGHVFNIVLDKAPDPSRPNIRPIFIVQSFIYKYTMKIWATNDLDDVKELLLNYTRIFLNGDEKFTLEDEKIARQLFGIPDITDYHNVRLVDRDKFRNFKIEKQTHFDYNSIMQRILNLSELCDYHIDYYKKNVKYYNSVIDKKGVDYNSYDSSEKEIINKIISIVYNDSKYFFIQDCTKKCKIMNIYNQKFDNIIVRNSDNKIEYIKDYKTLYNVSINIFKQIIHDIKKFKRILLEYKDFENNTIDYIYFDVNRKGVILYNDSPVNVGICNNDNILFN